MTIILEDHETHRELARVTAELKEARAFADTECAARMQAQAELAKARAAQQRAEADLRAAMDGAIDAAKLADERVRRAALAEAIAIVRSTGAGGNGEVDRALAEVESRIAVRSRATPSADREGET